MAKGKGKKVSSGVPHKKHGPTKKLFHEWSSTMRWHFAKAGLLNKYSNRTTFDMSCTARGVRNVPDWLWKEMCSLETKKEKDKWFRDLKTRNIDKEEKEREARKAVKETAQAQK